MIYFLKKISLLFFTLLLFSNEVQSTTKEANTLRKKLEQIRQDNNFSAAVILLVDKNNVLLNAHLGKAGWKEESPLKSDAIFRIGSISKSFAGLLALRMQEKGLIDLDKPFSTYVNKSYINNTFPKTEISLAQLLEHTAGLKDLSKAEWDFNDSTAISLEDAFDLQKGNHKTHWQPGLHSSYSNVGAGLLGLALEKAGGKSYEALMDKFVFQPLGMQSSTLLLTPAVKKNLITGYDRDGKSPIPYWHNIYRPFAAINTNAVDMQQFLQLMLNKGRLSEKPFISSQSLQRMEQPKTSLAAQSGLQYGYGLGNYQWQNEGYTFHGHGGDADGYLAHYGYNRDSGLGYFIMINAFNHKPLGQMRELIESFIIKDLAKPKYPLRKRLDVKILHRYTGEYAQITQRFGRLKLNQVQLRVFIKNKNLYSQVKGNPARILYPVNDQHFRYIDESIATVAFIHDGSDIYFRGDIGNFRKLESAIIKAIN